MTEIPFGEMKWALKSGATGIVSKGPCGEITCLGAGDKPVQFLFEKPIPLDPEARRIAIRCKGTLNSAVVNGSFLLTDADNRAFSYTIQGSLSSQSWQRLDTLEMRGEIRLADQGARSWTDITSEPKPPFSLHGFELFSKSETQRPVILLRSIEIENNRRSEFSGYWGVISDAPQLGEPYFEFTDQPILYGDRLFKNSGKYRIILTAQSRLNGDVVWNDQREIDYRPADGNAAIALDLPRGYFWITARVFSQGSGDYLFQKKFQLDVERRAAAPSISQHGQPLALEVTGAHLQNIFQCGEACSFHIKLPSGSPPSTVIEYEVTTYSKDPVIPKTALAVEKRSVIEVTLPKEFFHAGEAYQLKVSLKAQDKIIDESTCLFGYKNPVAIPPSILKPTPATLDIPGPLHMAICASWEPFHYGGSHYPIQEMQHVIDVATQYGFSCISLDVNWTHLEPLPGVFRFDELDQQVQMAKKAGLKVCLEVTGFYDAPEWVRSFPHLSDDEGQVHNLWFAPGVSLQPSPTSPLFLSSLQNLYQRLAERYGPEISGYTFSGLFADHFYLRYPYPGTTSLGDFQNDLREQYKGSLDGLNKRWSTKYTSWNQIDLPFQQKDIHQPDFSRPWSDFIRFRNASLFNYVKTVVDGVRAYDGKSWIQLYCLGGIDIVQCADYLKSRGGFIADGGSEQENDIVRTSSISPIRGIPEITESVMQCPRNRFDVDMVFTRLIYGGNTAYYRCIWNMSGARNDALRDQWMDCINYLSRDWKPVLEQLNGAQASPPQVGVLDAQTRVFDFLTSYEATQSWPAFKFNEALLNDHLLPLFIDGFADFSAIDKLKLLFVNSNTQRLSAPQLEKIVSWTRAGGRLVLFASSGRWDEENPAEDFVLPRRLGINLAFSGKRQNEAKIELHASPPFRKAYTLPLYRNGLDGFGGFDSIAPQGSFRPAALFADGSPAAIHFSAGKGDVILFLQSPDWNTAAASDGSFSGSGIFDDLLEWAGVQRIGICNRQDLRFAVVKKPGTDFLLVHRFMPFGTHDKPTEFNLSQPKLDGTVKLPGYPPLTPYRVVELTRHGGKESVLNGTELATKGLEMSGMILGETRVFALSSECLPRPRPMDSLLKN